MRSFNVILVVIFAEKCENGISTILVFAQNRMEYVMRRDVTYGRDATCRTDDARKRFYQKITRLCFLSPAAAVASALEGSNCP